VKRPTIYVALVTEKGRRSGLFHSDYGRGRPLCVETTERRCRAEVSGGAGGIIVPRDTYEVVRYVPLDHPEGA
jgi:hypothetical protein